MKFMNKRNIGELRKLVKNKQPLNMMEERMIIEHDAPHIWKTMNSKGKTKYVAKLKNGKHSISGSLKSVINDFHTKEAKKNEKII